MKVITSTNGVTEPLTSNSCQEGCKFKRKRRYLQECQCSILLVDQVVAQKPLPGALGTFYLRISGFQTISSQESIQATELIESEPSSHRSSNVEHIKRIFRSSIGNEQEPYPSGILTRLGSYKQPVARNMVKHLYECTDTLYRNMRNGVRAGAFQVEPRLQRQSRVLHDKYVEKFVVEYC